MAASSSTWSSRRGRPPRKPTLSPRVTPQLFNRGTFGDPALPPDLTPIPIRRPWTLGARGRTTRVNLSELNMQYGHVRAISRSVGAITVRSSGIQPWGDVVVLARTATGWKRLNLENGSVAGIAGVSRGRGRDAVHVDRGRHPGAVNAMGQMPAGPGAGSFGGRAESAQSSNSSWRASGSPGAWERSRSRESS